MKYVRRLIPLLLLVALIRHGVRFAAAHCHEEREPNGATL